jgi:HK97 family phage portal protein
MIQLNLSQPETRSVSKPAATPTSLPSPIAIATDWSWLRGGFGTDSNEVVSPESALTIPEVYSAVRVLAELISCMPLNLVKKTTSGHQIQIDNPIHDLFSAAVNPQTTSVEWLEQLVTNLMVDGNAYSQIIRSVDGSRVLGLYGLPPDSVQVNRLTSGAIEYRVQTYKGQVVLPENEVLCVKLNSRNGLHGMSPVKQCAQLLGSSLAVSRYSARFFSNNSVPPVILTVPMGVKVKPEDKPKMRAAFEEMQGGSSQHRTAVLDNGMDVKVLAFDPQSSQMCETQDALRNRVASIFRVPPWILGDTSKLTSGNLQELRQDLVTSVLRPLAKRIEAQIYLKILRPIDPSLHAHFDFADLLKGNAEETATAVGLGRQWSTMTIDESRVLEGRNPLGGVMGSSLLVPVNMSVVDSSGNVLVHPSANTAAPEPTTEGANNE